MRARRLMQLPGRLAAALALAACGGEPEAAGEPIAVSLEICPDACRRIEIGGLAAGASVIDAMAAARASGDLEARWRGAGASAFVEAIDGTAAPDEAGRWWIFAVNGADACVGPGVYALKAGDAVAWRLKSEASGDCG